ncbi:MAG: DUF3303 family protein [Pigmentiphaga sp.]
MLYLVISAPHPDNTGGVSERQRDFWAWIDHLKTEGRVLNGWRRMGRGAVVVFDAPDHDVLHGLLQQWAHRIPATFEVQPLISPPGAVEHPPATVSER